MPGFKGKNAVERGEESKALKAAAREAATEAEEEDLKAKAEVIDAGMAKDFLEVLTVVEAMKDAESGKTYAELLKAGEQYGVKLPSP